jgi:hypothetical protein
MHSVLVPLLGAIAVGAPVACNTILGIPEVDRFVADDAGPAPAPTGSVVGCAPGQKSCSGRCVSIVDPASGCATVDCTPCALAHAKNACVDGRCAIEVCEEGFANCNGARDDGCEANLRADPKNCNGCGSDCQGFVCVAGLCRCGSNDSCGFNGVCDQASCTCGGTVCSAGAACDAVDSCQF